MFPGIYGFHWDAGHLIFLGAFYSVLTLIAVTVTRSLMRTRRSIRGGEEPGIRWKCDFHDLPDCARRCRHELNGEIASRECPHAFDCRVCEKHASFGPAAPAPAPSFEILGMNVPLDRRYHRGHTWVRGESDGTFSVGLDPLAARLLGPSAVPVLPEPGAELTVNSPAWTMRDGASETRILSPVNGRVIETSRGGGWYLKVQPAADARTTHLLSGSEVEHWMNREVERLELALGGAALADGGSLVPNPGDAYPRDLWRAARAEFFLEP